MSNDQSDSCSISSSCSNNTTSCYDSCDSDICKSSFNSCSHSKSSNDNSCHSSNSSDYSFSDQTTYSSCDTQSDSSSNMSGYSSCDSDSSKSTSDSSKSTSDSSNSSCDKSSCDKSSCDKSSCDRCSICSSDSSCSKSSDCDSNFVIDLAVSEICIYPTSKVYKKSNFVGTRGLGHGYIYRGNTIDCCKCYPFDKCGIVKGKPQYPCCVIGTFTVDFTIINPQFNKAIKELGLGNCKTYIKESQRLSGRVLTDSQLRLSFSDSSDFYLPSEDTILISGRVPWGVKGQDWKMSINGGTGQYRKACGDAEAFRLIVANGSCCGFGESWRLCFDYDDITDC